jgi:F-box associated protein
MEKIQLDVLKAILSLLPFRDWKRVCLVSKSLRAVAAVQNPEWFSLTYKKYQPEKLHKIARVGDTRLFYDAFRQELGILKIGNRHDRRAFYKGCSKALIEIVKQRRERTFEEIIWVLFQESVIQKRPKRNLNSLKDSIDWEELSLELKKLKVGIQPWLESIWQFQNACRANGIGMDVIREIQGTWRNGEEKRWYVPTTHVHDKFGYECTDEKCPFRYCAKRCRLYKQWALFE